MADYQIKVGFTARVPQAPIYVAKEKGFYEGEKLNVELKPSNTATTALVPLLARGDLDVVFGGPTASLFNAMNQGIRFAIVADGGRIDPEFEGSPYLIVVRKDLHDAGKIKDLKDLKGTTISMGAQGTSLAYMMFRALEKANLKTTDINMRWFNSMVDVGVALENKAVDVAAMIAPINTGLTKNGISADWKDARELAPDMQAYMLIFSEDFVEKHRDEAIRFLRAYNKAIKWYKQQISGNDSELVSIVSKWTGLKPEQVKQTPWTYYDDQLRLNTEDLARQYKMWVDQGLAKPGLDLSKFVKDDLRKAAVAGGKN
jgi:NitT/TauT family transport system substrate-binding protein